MHDLGAHSQVPDVVQDTATKHYLGHLQATHISNSHSVLRMGSGVAAVIIGVAISGAYLLSYNSTFAWLPWWQSVIIPLIGIIWVLVGCWILFSSLFQPPLAVYVYSEGLLYVTRKIEVLFWHKIERVWKIAQPIAKRSDQAVKYKYIVRRSDGAHFEFQTSLSNSETLGALLEEETVRILLPRAIVAYTRGEMLLFDEIAINEYGIILREGRRKLSWPQLANLTITNMQLAWYKRGETSPWALISLELIPNVEVVRGLVTYALRSQERETSPKIVAYQAGATIDFGVLRVNQQGVSPDGSKQFIPWNEIAGIGVSDHEVMIGRKDTGQWYTFPDWMIQDPATLKDLVEYVLQKKKA